MFGFERVVGDEGGLAFVGAIIARAGGDGAETFDRGDEGKAALFRVGLVENEGVDLAAQRIEAQAARPVDEERELIVGRIARDRAPDEGEIARVVEAGRLAMGISSVPGMIGRMVTLGG